MRGLVHCIYDHAFAFHDDFLGHSRHQYALAFAEADGVSAVIGDGEFAVDAGEGGEAVRVGVEHALAVDGEAVNVEVRAVYEFAGAVEVNAWLGDVAGVDGVVDGVLGFVDMQLTGLPCLGVDTAEVVYAVSDVRCLLHLNE